MVNTEINQIDYILCSQTWRSSIQSAKTRPEADCGSDHELLLIDKLSLKLKKVGKNHLTIHVWRKSNPLQLYTSAQSFSHVWLFVNPLTAACQASLSITNSLSLLKLMPIELVILSNLLFLCHPILLPPSIFPTIKVFSDESGLHIR